MAKASGGSLTEQLRLAIRECGLTKDELSEATGVAHILIVHFMLGKDIGIKDASKIAAYLGFELRSKYQTPVPCS